MSSALEARLRKLFKAPRKGESFELRTGLVSQYAYERKDAIQRVIAAMTVGKDVSALFPDVLKNIATHDIEQKKLVYLYLMNYAKTNPELCILAVNTFVQDTEDPNPLVRALAIRTMGCIRVDKMVDYMDIPLKRTLKDDNPYVRKTGAICVAKLFDLNPEMCVEQGFLQALQDLVADPNPMVVANAVSALAEIQESDPSTQCFQITSKVLKKLLLALNECTEWGRVTILSALSEYESVDQAEAHHIIERVVPQLQHVNTAVVLAGIKTVISHIEKLSSTEYEMYLKKLSSPLVALMSTSPEAQYVGIRNIRVILEKYPQLLSRELRVFYVKYSDPLYLKLEKLEIMVRLANDKNAPLLLSELKEYAMEVDADLVKRAVSAIAQVAIKLPDHAMKAVELLNFLVNQRGDYVVAEAVKVFRDLLRRYKTTEYVDAIVPVVSANWESLDDAEATAAYIWILGEYPQKFTRLDRHLQKLAEGFLEETSVVQLATLNAIVKTNLRAPTANSGNYLQSILNCATSDVENADVRDKAYLYWRLLSSDSGLAAKVLLNTELPPIPSTIALFTPALLAELVSELGTLASVYHKPSYTFTSLIAKAKILRADNIEEIERLAKREIVANAKSENLLDFGDDEEIAAPVASSLDELSDVFGSSSQAPLANSDILGLFGSSGVDSGMNSQAADI
ncbi:hypothetical protein BABINDRAFT_169980 [Babjeviella inositovora NRRL Y-12698]|uniref:AP complex subunit beta n=1 Tax=Babjeviella inositovora NRRL Y-12698 TaxID=984486 RepID=A0A1E3QYW6_9ASCO|nr:uncharacterized protein BABINDRAFT_169980 [Babjeviella inositovora NRRL Y-12698]ODQ82826.1 hypothetical protein BABINDRAFT_169980 [Babjeviella inositovora NRRL Y-12698]